MAEKKASSRPGFSSLPLDPKGPPGNAWGLYGLDDSLGALNLLTPTVVKAAAAEIQTGERVSLDWSLDKPIDPGFSRLPLERITVPWKNSSGETVSVNDDELHFNSQCGSQWDGFRHYGYQKTKKYYNNHKFEDFGDPTIIGIDAWVQKGGIVGRGVLLDYPSYCKRHSLPLNALSSCSITVADLKKLLQEYDIRLREGDIMFLRTGFTEAYEKHTPEEQKTLGANGPNWIGLEATPDALRWLWDAGFAAVASDNPSFERAPVDQWHSVKPEGWTAQVWEDDMMGGGLLHQWLIGGWGLPIGELFDLEELSRKCRELQRWTFFVSSMPLKVPGGIASPPNAVAIF